MDVIERFLKYVSFDTQSDADSTTVPTTKKQKVLGAYLAKELAEMGMEQAHMDDNGYVWGFLPATPGYEHLDTLGLIAHMDTSPDVSGADVHPKTVRYTGGDVRLENGEVISLATFPFLAKYEGQELIVTDGNTLLGADDKAGVAEIFSACEYLIAHPEIPHGRIAVGITPDEEVGSGADHFDLKKFGARFAYTVDGGELGEIEYENFNAAGAKLTVKGVNIHPGSAKDRMKNAILMANEFVSKLPPMETPAHTEGYEGFYHVHSFEGAESQATVSLLIRDHDKEKFLARKEFLEALVKELNEEWGGPYFSIEIKDSYYNMKEKILPHMELIENAKRAMAEEGIEPCILPIRGGTDGARLSFEGLPCPNLCTGGANFHGIHEFIPVESMRKMVNVLVRLMKA
ncbi:MAG: peptidase T [Clostridia bacterium]|nr:peptidase T [Clostridia bacterium]